MSEQHDRPSGDRLLHRYHDGELLPVEREALQATLDGEAREKLAALDEIGGSLRAIYGEPAMPPLDLWPALEREIAQSKVIPLSRRLRRRAPLLISTFSTVALAVAVLLVLLLPRAGGHPSNECDIDDLEVSGANATILKVADDKHGGSTTVLWLEE